jgi:hypothetical protein
MGRSRTEAHGSSPAVTGASLDRSPWLLMPTMARQTSPRSRPVSIMHRIRSGRRCAQTAILSALAGAITTLQGQVEAHFGRHPDAEICLSQPGLGSILANRSSVLGVPHPKLLRSQ